MSLHVQNGDVWRFTWNFRRETGPAHVGHGRGILAVFLVFVPYCFYSNFESKMRVHPKFD